MKDPKILRETDLFEAIASKSKLNKDKYGDGIIKIIREHTNKLKLKTDVEGFEADLTGKQIADWIKPLHFENNLNSAIRALNQLEKLINERDSHLLALAQFNHLDSYFSKEDNGLQKDLHKTLKNVLKQGFSSNEYFENITIRILHKIYDLIEYTKAVKLGGKLLFGYEYKTPEYDGFLDSINRIRESLRYMLQEYYKTANTDQETIIPISLKQALNSSKNRLVDKWGDTKDPIDNAQQRATVSPLTMKELKFDLRQYPDISKLNFQRIRRIGINIIDNRIQTANVSSNENSLHPHLWSAELIDESGGYRLGESSNAKSLLLNSIQFDNIHPNTQNSITWCQYDALMNFNAARKWKLIIKEKSHDQMDYSSIRDIYVYFHLAFQP